MLLLSNVFTRLKHDNQIICAFVAVIFYSCAIISQLLLIAFVLPNRCVTMKEKKHDRQIWVTCDIFTSVLSPGVNSLRTRRRAAQSHRLGCPCQAHLTGQASSSSFWVKPVNYLYLGSAFPWDEMRSNAPPSRWQKVSLVGGFATPEVSHQWFRLTYH